MISPIGHRRLFTGQCGQLPFQEIAKRHAQRIDVLPVAVDKIHRHIQRVFGVSFKAKALVKGKRQHTGPGVIQMPPDFAAPGFMAVWLALKKRRVGKQCCRHWLQGQRHPQFFHHVCLGPEVEIDLHGSRAPHHITTHGPHFGHVVIHQLIPPLGHQWHLIVVPDRRRAQTNKANTDLIGDVLDLAQVNIHLVTGFVDGL